MMTPPGSAFYFLLLCFFAFVSRRCPRAMMGERVKQHCGSKLVVVVVELLLLLMMT